MRSVAVLVAGSLTAILFTALADPANAQTCKQDGPTLVCAHDGKQYRIIDNTASPSKRFAIAWLPKKPVDAGAFDSDSNGHKHNLGESSENFIVRLSDGRTLRKTPGTHPGDLDHYNHRQKIALWSPKETWLVEIDEDKWTSDVVHAYRFGKDGTASPGFSLLAPLRKAALAYLAEQKTKIDTSKFVDSVHAKEIGDDGTMDLTFIMQVPKKQSYEFQTKVALSPKGDAVKIDVRSMAYDPNDID